MTALGISGAVLLVTRHWADTVTGADSARPSRDTRVTLTPSVCVFRMSMSACVISPSSSVSRVNVIAQSVLPEKSRRMP